MSGRVAWKIFTQVNDSESIEMVNRLIKEEQNVDDFDSLWMLVVSWDNVTVQGDSVSNSSRI